VGERPRVTRLTQGFVEVDGGRLYFEVAGDGPSVVLLHPGLWDRRTWDEQFVTFSRRYRVLRYDLRGYGRSSRPEPDRPYSHVTDLGAAMDAAGMDRAALVGCSMGGAIELDFTLVHPERVTALVLAAPGLGGFEATADEEAWYSDLGTEMEAAMRAGDLERVQDLRLQIWAPLGSDDPAGARIREIAFDNLHEITMDEGAAEQLDPPAIERLAEIAAPTLVLSADHDPPDMARICRTLAARISGARLVQIFGTDHVINVRRPAEFDAAVLAFLAEVL
jgi:pimeloyl-ACP methyl ester carboxylesterase